MRKVVLGIESVLEAVMTLVYCIDNGGSAIKVHIRILCHLILLSSPP